MSRPMPKAVPWDGPYWDAISEHQLSAQVCRRCGRLQHYPRPACVDCLSQEFDWQALSGEGTVYSFTVVRQEGNPAFETPFVLLDVELAEGIRMVSRLVDEAELSVRIGDAVKVRFVDVGGGQKLPYFDVVTG